MSSPSQFSRARPSLIVVLLLLAAMLLAPSAAIAARGTYTPPMLRGDLNIGYQGGTALVQLEDRSDDNSAWTEVASYSEQSHGMMISGSFAPYHGISVSLDLPILFHRQLSWASGNAFDYDPVTQRATLAGADALDALALEASQATLRRFGFGDMGLSFRIVPFAQEGLPNRQAPINMAFDIALRFPSGKNGIETREDGTGHPGLGGPGITVGTTASRSFGAVEPYLSIHFSHNGPYLLDGEESEEGEGHSAGDAFRLRVGSAITALFDAKQGRAVNLDVSLGATYLGPEHTVSGLQLPTTLPETQGKAAVISEHVKVGGALELSISPRPQIEIHMNFDAAWISPHSVERVTTNAYSVRTRNGSFQLNWGAGVRVHFL